ncbi:MAG: protein kinase [Vicinamibacterales bacterium]
MTPGSRLGPYEIISALGAGGMGEVYRARDTKLNREVALKILPEAVASDPDRLVRFTREAQTLAALNHPNIGALYGIEESGAVRALVMELIEGDDLSVLIARDPEHRTDTSLVFLLILASSSPQSSACHTNPSSTPARRRTRTASPRAARTSSSLAGTHLRLPWWISVRM